MYDNNYTDIISAQNGDTNKMTSLVEKNMGLVYNITKRFQGRGYDIEDLNQIGAMGLIKAIKNFDTNYNVQLSTYSVPYIIGEIKRYIRDDGSIKVSRGIKELATKINIIRKEYLDTKNEEITIDQIVKILNVSKEDIICAIDATSNTCVASIDEPIANGDGKICISDMIQSENNEENDIANRLSIQKLLNELNERDKKIMVLRYFKCDTQTEVSKLLGISQVQISRIEKKLLIEMRKKLISNY